MNKQDIEMFCVGENLYFNDDEKKESLPFTIMVAENDRLVGRVLNEGITVVCDSDETMAKVDFGAIYPIKENPYRFHRNDCIIALGHKNDDDDVYARVLKVDIKEGTVTIEKFHQKGKKYIGDFVHNLEELQSKALYIPMTAEEREIFSNNIDNGHKKRIYISNGNGKMILQKENSNDCNRE